MTTVTLPYEVVPWYKGRFALRTGIVLVAETAMVSIISVTGLLAVIALRVIKRRIRERDGRALPDDIPLQPVSILFLLAMFMELLQGIGSIMSIRWAFHGAVTEGHYCTAQAVIKQMGNDGAALFTMFLGVMTLVSVIRPYSVMGDRGRKIVLGMVGFVCLFWLLMITIPATTIDHYYGSTGPWCWIYTNDTSKIHNVMTILSEYGWFWLASLTCFVSYGYIVARWWRESPDDPQRVREAFIMAWYPIAYFVEIFGQSVVRVRSLDHDLNPHFQPVPDGWTIFTSIFFASSGWVNVFLWVVTGRQFGFSASSTSGASASGKALRGSRYTDGEADEESGTKEFVYQDRDALDERSGLARPGNGSPPAVAIAGSFPPMSMPSQPYAPPRPEPQSYPSGGFPGSEGSHASPTSGLAPPTPGAWNPGHGYGAGAGAAPYEPGAYEPGAYEPGGYDAFEGEGRSGAGYGA